MEVTYEHKRSMTFIGFSTSIRPEEGYQKCPEFWNKEYAGKYARLWQIMKPETPVEAAIFENNIGLFAICDEKEDTFEYWIAGLYKGGEVPEGLKLYTFPESDWAMFSARGPLPGSLQELNTQVWKEWYPNEGQKFRSNGNAMLEVYSRGDMKSPDYECGIWVPLRKNEKENEYEAEEIVSTMMLTGIL
ncbi:MAG: GyrI-like domain-containing protein [Candidatus Limivivens sp.]|nr:GyrI-like domain-containing protein [Candidatus Limivivens sp.]